MARGAGNETPMRMSRRKHLAVAGVAGVFLLVVTLLRAMDPAFVESIRLMGFDTYQRLWPRADDDYPVRIVDIDERSLAMAPSKLQEFVRLVRDAFEHSARDVPPVVREGQPDQRGARVVAPVRGEQPAKGGHEDEALGTAGHLRGEGGDLCTRDHR